MDLEPVTIVIPAAVFLAALFALARYLRNK